METNENEHRTFQRLWDVAYAILRRQYIAIYAYVKKQEKYPTESYPYGARKRTANKTHSQQKKENNQN